MLFIALVTHLKNTKKSEVNFFFSFFFHHFCRPPQLLFDIWFMSYLKSFLIWSRMSFSHFVWNLSIYLCYIFIYNTNEINLSKQSKRKRWMLLQKQLRVWNIFPCSRFSFLPSLEHRLTIKMLNKSYVTSLQPFFCDYKKSEKENECLIKI
jgi:hypothetical protein